MRRLILLLASVAAVALLRDRFQLIDDTRPTPVDRNEADQKPTAPLRALEKEEERKEHHAQNRFTACPELRGQVVHVGSGTERPFRGEDELVAFVRSRLEVVALSRAVSTEEVYQ
jgi:hypothetical protein